MKTPKQPLQIERGTVYLGGTSAYSRTEARQISYQICPHAQFDQAIKLVYKGKGRRKTSTRIITSGQLVILSGWGHPAPPRLWSDGKPLEPIPTDWGQVTATICRPRYPLGDKRWIAEFDDFLNGYLHRSGAELLLDFRNHDFKDRFQAKRNHR